MPDSELSPHKWTQEERLSWAELQAGVPCRGCGRPFHGPIDPDEELAFEEAHAGHGHKHGFSDGPTHCAACCGPPPLSPAQIEKIWAIVKTPEATGTLAEAEAAITRAGGFRAALDQAQREADGGVAIALLVKLVDEGIIGIRAVGGEDQVRHIAYGELSHVELTDAEFAVIEKAIRDAQE